jgi:hypothetical protein
MCCERRDDRIGFGRLRSYPAGESRAHVVTDGSGEIAARRSGAGAGVLGCQVLFRAVGRRPGRPGPGSRRARRRSCPHPDLSPRRRLELLDG